METYRIGMIIREERERRGISQEGMFLNLILGNVDMGYSKGQFAVAGDVGNARMLTYPFFAINGSFRDNLYGIPEKEELKQLLNIDFEDQMIKSNPINLSYGQQQKLALLRVFSDESSYLFLDEPLTNLDISTQKRVIEYIKSLKGKHTILAVMHLDELDDAADKILYIRDNRLYVELA